MRRRDLLKSAAVGTGVLAAAATGLAPSAAAEESSETEARPGRLNERSHTGRDLRRRAADTDYPEPLPAHRTNGDDTRFGGLSSYTKGLPHDDLGVVEPAALAVWNKALASGKLEDFNQVPLGVAGGRKQLGPVGGLAYDLLGADTAAVVVPPAPSTASARTAAELAELYWLALLRDVPFAEYDGNPLVAQAAADLSGFAGFAGPKVGGEVTPGTLFRYDLPGTLVGPVVSQFSLYDVQYGPTRIPQRHDTVQPGLDFATEWDDFLALQRGVNFPTKRDFVNTRYMQNVRDLAHFTHFDVLYQQYLYAAAILLTNPDYPAKLQNPGNPYFHSTNQMGFNTFGTPHVVTLLAEVALRAIKHTEFQQFFVHRRIRPEALAGRVEVTKNRSKGRFDHVLHRDILDAGVLDRVQSKYGSVLLPQGFPEGSPMSPSYQSGHSTVAGACVTILKAWFNGDYVLPNPVVPSTDGTTLVPYTGADHDKLTVAGELNKIAANIAGGRAAAGVHYRSDNTEAFKLGEAIAVGLLREEKANYVEQSNFVFTGFDGSTITI